MHSDGTNNWICAKIPIRLVFLDPVTYDKVGSLIKHWLSILVNHISFGCIDIVYHLNVLSCLQYAQEAMCLDTSLYVLSLIWHWVYTFVHVVNLSRLLWFALISRCAVMPAMMLYSLCQGLQDHAHDRNPATAMWYVSAAQSILLTVAVVPYYLLCAFSVHVAFTNTYTKVVSLMKHTRHILLMSYIELPCCTFMYLWLCIKMYLCPLICFLSHLYLSDGMGSGTTAANLVNSLITKVRVNYDFHVNVDKFKVTKWIWYSALYSTLMALFMQRVRGCISGPNFNRNICL